MYQPNNGPVKTIPTCNFMVEFSLYRLHRCRSSVASTKRANKFVDYENKKKKKISPTYTRLHMRINY